MRPSVEIDGQNHYECTSCGERVVGVDAAVCDCGGELRNISRSRDL